MAIRVLAAAAGLALGLGLTNAATAMNLQPGMLTMMQQGGQEHGVQVGCTLPGYDPRFTCSYSEEPWSYRAKRHYDGRVRGYGRY